MVSLYTFAKVYLILVTDCEQRRISSQAEITSHIYGVRHYRIIASRLRILNSNVTQFYIEQEPVNRKFLDKRNNHNQNYFKWTIRLSITNNRGNHFFSSNSEYQISTRSNLFQILETVYDPI